MKHVFIVNPISGAGSALKEAKKIDRFAKKENLDYEVYYTKCQRDAYNFVKNYKGKKIIFHSLGGDGTVNEVASGVMGTDNYLSIIPNGSGNDFYRTIRKTALIEFKCDICKINDRYFINVASVGLDADVAKNSYLMKDFKIPRKQIYNLAIFYTLLNYRSRTLEIEIDGKLLKQKTLMVALCNGRLYGGGIRIATDASIDDGLMDVLIIEKSNIFGVISGLIKLIRGKVHTYKKLKKYKAKKVVIKYKKPIYSSYDGEMMESNKFEFEVLDKKVNIYNDRDFIRRFLEFK